MTMTQDRKFVITDARRGAALPIRVVTQAAHTEFAGVLEDGVIRVRLTAHAAGDPSANAELLAFLAAAIGAPEEQFEVVAGANERDKIVTIEGVTLGEVESALQRAGL
jgi:uncharacterized protein YggU (UPF0235/DUF167 family)